MSINDEKYHDQGQAPRSPWRRILLEQSAPSPAVANRRAFFAINDIESKKSGHLHLELKFRERLKSGDLGALRSGRFSSANLAEFDSPEDRAILGLILSPLNIEKISFRTKADSLSLEIDDLLAPAVIAKMDERLLKGDTPLAIGVEPWTFELQVIEEKHGLRIEGLLTRGREKVDLKTADCLLECGFFLTTDSIERVGWGQNFALARHLFAHSLSLPRSEEADLIVAHSRAEELPPLRLPTDLQWPMKDAEPFAVARFQSQADGSLHLRVSCVYGKTEIAFDDPKKIIFEAATKSRIKRNAKAEKQFLKILSADTPKEFASLDSIPPLVADLQKAGWLVLLDSKPVAPFRSMTGTLKEEGDAYFFDAAFEFEGEKRLALREFFQAVSRGERVSRFADHQVAFVPNEWLDRMNLLMRGASFDKSGRMTFQRVSLPIYRPIFEEIPDLKLDAGVQRVFGGLENLLEHSTTEKPRELKANLRPYQAEGLAWLDKIAQSGFGGILADDMGLGKTIQIISYLLRRATIERNGPRPSLVVLPKSLVFNWQAEIEKFGPRLRVLDFAGGNRGMLKANDYDVVVTTYHILKNEIDRFEKFEFDSIILDEAQTIKNPTSQIAKACFQLKGRHKFALTGTPIENSLGDLFSLMKFANPGLIPTGLEGAANGGRLPPAATKKLAVAVSPFILRRTKKQVLTELPDKSEQVLVCELEGEQKKMYDQVRKQFRESLKNQKDPHANRMQVFEALLRLRQISCHPDLVDPEKISIGSSKVEMVLEHLAEIRASGQKALLFSQFTSFLGLLKPELEAAGIPFEYLDGQTRDRRAAVENFNSNPDTTVFLISLKAGGTGLNLTTASYVFLLDPWWNPAAEAQAIDRAYRMGQKQKVMAYRLIAKGTIEEKILKLQAQKRSLAESVISDDQAFLRNLSLDDLSALLE